MQFFWIQLYNGTYADFLAKIFAVKKPTLVFTPNPEILYRAYHDDEFMQILGKADYNVPDGNGLYVGTMQKEGKSFLRSGLATFFHKKNVYKKYGELIKGSDMVRDILESAWRPPLQRRMREGQGDLVPMKASAKSSVSSQSSSTAPLQRSLKILVIDRKNAVPKNDLERKKVEVQKHLKSLLETQYPWTEIHAIFDGEMAADGIAHYIELHKIDFVFSCIGMKNQEKRLVEIFSYLPDKIPVVGLGVGASIDFLLGLQKRAPKVFRDSGLEWFYRLITQPRIRYKRIKTALIDFPRLVKKSSKT